MKKRVSRLARSAFLPTHFLVGQNGTGWQVENPNPACQKYRPKWVDSTSPTHFVTPSCLVLHVNVYRWGDDDDVNGGDSQQDDLPERCLMWHPLTRHTYLYNIIYENAELIKMILFNKHKGTHVDKKFTFALITKLKTYQIGVWKHLWPKTRSSNFYKRKQVK